MLSKKYLYTFTFIFILIASWGDYSTHSFGAKNVRGAYFPLEIANIKPAGTGNPAIPSTNRIFRAYPGIEYNIRAAVLGGLYPFTFSLRNAPAGMTINASTGEISWPNPQADSGTITLSVTDAENTTVTTTWAITVSTSGFKFVDSSYSGTETGSITQPFSSIAKLLAASGANTDIAYFRAGTYLLPGSGEILLTNKAHTWIGYPGESATVSGQSSGAYIRSDYSQSTGAIYIDDMRFANFTSHAFMLRGGHNYQTIRRSNFSHITATNPVNNNYGFIYTTSAQANPGQYFTIQDNEFSYFTGASAIGSIYDCDKMLLEDNYIHDCGGGGVSGIENGISAKYRTDQLTVRHNRIIMTTGYPFGRGGMNGGLYGADGIDCSFNLFIQQSANPGYFVNDFNGGSYNTADTTKNIYFYRNTVVGYTGFEYLDGTDCTRYGQGPFILDHNVFINANTKGSGFFVHNYIAYGESHSSASTSPWNCITDTNNLKGTAANNIVDSNGNLTSSYLSYLGTHGYQTTSGNIPPPPPKSPNPPTLH